MKIDLNPFFGKIPANSDNLEIVGTFSRRFEERGWATVWPASGVVRWPDGSIENETLWVMRSCCDSVQSMERELRDRLSQCGDFNSKWSWLPRRVSGRFFNLSLFWSSGYFHWMCDVLPRLHNVLARLTPDVHVILSPYVNGWQKRSLELLGLPKNRWFFHSGKRPLKVERLLYASPVAMTGDHEVNSLNWVRDTIWQSCLGGLPSVVGKRKLYLTRKGTWSRSVANESEFLPALLERGFQIVDCGALTFEEQVRLFSEAVVVVGPHGAALTNILWSPPGIKVFEIFEPVAVRRCYWSMCRTLGHKHYCGIGQSITQSNQEPNIYVPLEEFKRALEIIDIG